MVLENNKKRNHKHIPTRVIGVIAIVFIISFVVASVQYWANVLIQEARGDTGALSFWTGLMLILVFKANFWIQESMEAILKPCGFWDRKR